MKAMLLRAISDLDRSASPLDLDNVATPEPGKGEVRIKVSCCGVCHTELDEIEGRTAPSTFPRILGHEVVGIIDKLGPNTIERAIGERVGVGWIFSGDGSTEENIHESFQATGRDSDGGYAEWMVVNERYCYPIPDCFSSAEAAPLLCAGGVGYRALKLCGISDGERLGLTGFGGSAHIVIQVVRYLYPNTRCYVFARSKNERNFAKELGATWAGDIPDKPPELLDAIIDTTPAWKPVVNALENLKPGGRLVINAIRKSDKDKHELQNIKYRDHLWLEKEIKSVANVTADDLREFLPIAAKARIKPTIERFKLEDANSALLELHRGNIRGAKVLCIDQEST